MPDPTPLDELKAAIAGGKALLVCGAGVSRAVAGNAAPGWKALIESAFNEASRLSGENLSGLCRSMLAGNDIDVWLNAANIAQKKLGGWQDEPYRAWLKASVGGLKAPDPCPLLDAIKDLKCRLATTNYDDLLRFHLGAQAETWLNPEAAAEVLTGENALGIWHIHGYWREPQSVIFSNSDYERVRSSDRSQFLQKQAAFADTFIFIGCSADGLADENIGELLKWFAKDWGGLGKKHFALVLDDAMSASAGRRPSPVCHMDRVTMSWPIACAASHPRRRHSLPLPTRSKASTSLFPTSPPSGGSMRSRAWFRRHSTGALASSLAGRGWVNRKSHWPRPTILRSSPSFASGAFSSALKTGAIRSIS